MKASPRTAANAQVDAYLNKAGPWQEVMEKLRVILLAAPLTETLKWGKPCYASDDRNIVLMMGFKHYCTLLFPAGALLKDDRKLLVRPTENTQAARQLRITSAAEVDSLKSALKSFISQAIELEKSGRKVSFKSIDAFAIPQEFQSRLDENLALKTAFNRLTPGRRRGYLLHFSSAKQSTTRASRVEKCMPGILAGKGLDD